MTQPFRSSTQYTSAVWPAVTITHRDDHLLLRSPMPLTTVSSALWRGGVTEATHFINWRVPLTYRCEDPTIMMRDQLQAWGYPVDASIGLQTAAKITHASIVEEDGDRYRLICCATAGTRNSARAGKARETFSAYECGTINIFLLADAHLTPSAMVNGIITATEAKAAALQDLRISDEGGEPATGTTTDSVVFAATLDEAHGAPHQFAGVATTIGNAIGRLVYESVHEAVATQGEP
ncbi:adenosylcobinamide amidohydrolase [Aneurinibacillus sp. BA2021]|nr:adenosylcobinamide amidohydrolase [Aneurinibacillus sp. BA2021]